MVDQKSENIRTLAGNHGGLRRGTAAAALGAVLVLSAGVPASNAAAPASLTDAGDRVRSDAEAVPGAAPQAAVAVSQVKATSEVKTTVDGTVSLEAWAGAILGDDEDDDGSSASPAPSVSPSSTPVPVPTAPAPTPPATPLPVTPTTSPTTSPAPAPAPPPTSAAASGTSPSQTSAPAPAAPRPGYSPAAGVPAPATRQAPAAQSGVSRLGPAVQPAPAQPAEAPAGVPVPATGSAAETPDRSAQSKLDTATSRPGAAGITSEVWGSGRLSSPMNMGTVNSRYSISRPSSAVLSSTQSGPISPMVWAGAGLVLLAGAAGLVAYKLRRAL
ncbi:hypothetical protein [Arthrobacter sp. D1-17]